VGKSQQFAREQISDKRPIPQKFHDLHAALTAQYPCISTLSDDDIDNGVWSDGPLINNFTHEIAIIGLRFDKLEIAVDRVIDIALEHDCMVLDPQGEQIYRS